VKKLQYSYVFLLSSLLLTGCWDLEKHSDQTIIKEEHKSIGNPEPSPRHFRANNMQHKIILGVFDSGVDYNHPELKRNIHFDLDRDGQPIGAGRDFLALDNWASNRLVNTRLYKFQFLYREKGR